MKKALIAFAALEGCLLMALLFFFLTDTQALLVYSLIIGLIVLTSALGVVLLCWKKK